MNRSKLIQNAQLTEVIDESAVLFIRLREGKLIVSDCGVVPVGWLRRSIDDARATQTIEKIYRLSTFTIGSLLDGIPIVGRSTEELKMANDPAFGESQLEFDKLGLHPGKFELHVAVSCGKDFLFKHCPTVFIYTGRKSGASFNTVIHKGRG